eukprot:CAMPEP_0169129920 /NCGR_PEP_ID=MMETSP1015-20121227/37407_1 /TAXON_ID=342587 /ORGANISM="Karlodinium micrum, Strain CCMP2283" /LENGTH=173 /DNA_ID=CAMNT_0009194019 /DNA_START=117 /DNA_END=638 /DNA_ORIENTATION=-
MQVANFEISWELLSRIGALAMQDLIQMGLVIACLVVSWLTVSKLLQFIATTSSHSGSKLRNKLADCDIQGVGTLDAFENVDALDSEDDLTCIDKVQPAQCKSSAGFALLESYGIFGAMPGAWSKERPHCTDLDCSFTEEEAEPVTLRTPRGYALLEHYGVFGVSPKHWGGYFL